MSTDLQTLIWTGIVGLIVALFVGIVVIIIRAGA